MLHLLCLLRQFAIHTLCYFLCFVAPTCKVFHDGNYTLNTNTSIALLAECSLCHLRGRILIYIGHPLTLNSWSRPWADLFKNVTSLYFLGFWHFPITTLKNFLIWHLLISYHCLDIDDWKMFNCETCPRFTMPFCT